MLPAKTYSSPHPIPRFQHHLGCHGQCSTTGTTATWGPMAAGLQGLGRHHMLQNSLEDMKIICLFYFKIHGYINLYQVNIISVYHLMILFCDWWFGHLEKTTLCPQVFPAWHFLPYHFWVAFPASKTGGFHPQNRAPDCGS